MQEAANIERKNLPLESLAPNEWNPNVMTDQAFNRLVQEIRENGFLSELQVVPDAKNEGKYIIIGGEHRYRAAQQLGYEWLPCVVLKDEKFGSRQVQELMTVRMNVIRGSMTPERFMKMYQRAVETYGHDPKLIQGLFAITDDKEFASLVKTTVEKAKKSLPVELHPQLIKVTKEVKTVDGLSAAIAKLMKENGETVPSSYIFFQHGKKEHLMVQATAETLALARELLTSAKEMGVDANDVLQEAFAGWRAKSISRRDEE